MFLEKSKSRIEAEFAKRAAEVPAVKEAEKEIETYRPEVALALKFLYTTMPLSDVGNYGVSSFLDYAEHGVFLWENSPYVKKMPEEIFLNYILYHRINTEEILDCRSIFYEDLKDRIQGKSMAEAAIEINYWCAEKATYHTTDNRTIAPHQRLPLWKRPLRRGIHFHHQRSEKRRHPGPSGLRALLVPL